MSATTQILKVVVFLSFLFFESREKYGKIDIYREAVVWCQCMEYYAEKVGYKNGIYDSCFRSCDSNKAPLTYYYAVKGHQLLPFDQNISDDSLSTLYWKFIKVRDSLCLYTNTNHPSPSYWPF